MRRRWIVTAGFALATAVVFAGCSGSQPLSTREEGTGIGALLGGGGGAAIGAATGHPALGALIGAGVGGVGGYAVGNSMQNQENANAQTQSQVEQQQQEIENQRQQIEQMKSQQDTE